MGLLTIDYAIGNLWHGTITWIIAVGVWADWVSPVDEEEGCFTCGEVWSYAITGECLVNVLVPVGLVILTVS